MDPPLIPLFLQRQVKVGHGVRDGNVNLVTIADKTPLAPLASDQALLNQVGDGLTNGGPANAKDFPKVKFAG